MRKSDELNVLDDLIGEHENFKINLKWDRNERLFCFAMRLWICILLTTPAIMILGGFGLLVSLPAWFAAKKIIPNPKYRDPFTRYSHK